MIHLKLRLLKTWTASDDLIKVLKEAPAQSNVTLETLPPSFEEGIAIIQFDEKEMATGFPFIDDNGDRHVFIDIHPSMMQFQIGLQYAQHTEERKKHLLKISYFRNQEEMSRVNVWENAKSLSAFMACASICVTSLMNSIESAVNVVIENYQGVLVNGENNPIDKFKILRNWPVEKKVEVALMQIANKNFMDDHPKIFDEINKLKELRDRFVHIKMTEFSTDRTYRDLIVRALRFSFELALDACQEFINYYEPALIERCNCGGAVHKGEAN